MNLNSDFSKRALVHASAIEWVPSPMAGVDRRMLDRLGDEVARATSIVRYAPQSQFSAHVHQGGEEFLVLEGVFEDEHGAYPAGTYVRNPPTSKHTPGSKQGCVIFVKLWQFDLDDRTAVSIDAHSRRWNSVDARAGVSAKALFADAREQVRLERWDPGATVDLETPNGAEFLVLSGDCVVQGEPLAAFSWLRLPLEDRLRAVAGPEGAQLWVKTGHLGHIRAPHS